MFNITALINERKNYALGNRFTPWKDELLAKIIEDEVKEDIAFVTMSSAFCKKKEVEALQKKYHFVGVYQIGAVFTNTNTQFYIVHLSKSPVTELKTALFYSRCFNAKEENNSNDCLCTPSVFSDEWINYIELLESWMNGESTPKSDLYYEFNSIPSNQLYNGSLAPETYSKENIDLRKLMDKQDTKVLSDLAQIISPVVDYKGATKGKVLSLRDLKYPLDVDSIASETPTSVVLKKGDVVIPRVKSKVGAYLFNYDGKETVFASRNLIVIRCTEIIPEYLYLYLVSDISLKVLNARYTGTVVQRITAQEIAGLPIACPTQDEQKYVSDFQSLTNFGIRSYDQLQKIQNYYERLNRIQHEDEKPKAIEDILNIELADTIKAYREDQLRSFLSDDLKELNTCFREKAYKATLILAGSILEAVLIDWVSEIHHKNYFEEEYCIIDRNGRQKRAELIDYINEIKYIRRPRWADEAAKAHEIRKKRNLVHAKLCLKSDDINEQVCRDVISYLSDVLKTRGVNMKNRI